MYITEIDIWMWIWNNGTFRTQQIRLLTQPLQRPCPYCFMIGVCKGGSKCTDVREKGFEEGNSNKQGCPYLPLTRPVQQRFALSLRLHFNSLFVPFPTPSSHV